MAKRVRGKTQAQKQRDALRKLKSTGLYKGKLDLRRKPTEYQKRLITRYNDVLTGKAKAVKPADPASYKGIYKVFGDTVIVPRRKGEKIKVDKKGNIVSERKVGKRTVRARHKRVRADRELSTKPGTIFFVPFIRGRDAKGEPILEWKRFPTREVLLMVMGTYEARERSPYTSWQDYVVEERIDSVTDNEAALYRKLSRKSGKAKKKLRFEDEGDE